MHRLGLTVLAVAALAAVAAPAQACALYVGATQKWKADVVVEGTVVRQLSDSRRIGPDEASRVPGEGPTNEAYLFRIDRKTRDKVGVGETLQFETLHEISYSYCDPVLFGLAPAPGSRARLYLTLDRKTRAFHRLLGFETLAPPPEGMPDVRIRKRSSRPARPATE